MFEKYLEQLLSITPMERKRFISLVGDIQADYCNGLIDHQHYHVLVLVVHDIENNKFRVDV